MIVNLKTSIEPRKPAQKKAGFMRKPIGVPGKVARTLFTSQGIMNCLSFLCLLTAYKSFSRSTEVFRLRKSFPLGLLPLVFLLVFTFFIAAKKSLAEPGTVHNKEVVSQHELAENPHLDKALKLVEIAADVATKAGIKSEIVDWGPIKQTLTLYGKTVVDPTRTSDIRARFAGTITKIQVNIGDQVQAGDLLIEIESNESLRRYPIVSPLSGIITARNANPGELAQNQILLSVVNYDRIWVEFRVFPSQIARISVGQTVTVAANNLQFESAIKQLLPNNAGYPFMIARVPLKNRHRQWILGQLLTGNLVIKKIPAVLRIDKRALQSVDGEQVVFVQLGNHYQVRPLKLGLSDDQFIEVIQGLSKGERYVVDKSYLLKADLEKSAASHDH